MNLAPSAKGISRSSLSSSLLRLIIFPGVILLVIIILYHLPDMTRQAEPPSEYLFTKNVSLPEEANYFDVLKYHLKLEVDFHPDLKGGELTGTNVIIFKSLHPELRRIVLNFNSSLKIDSISINSKSWKLKQGLLYIQLRRTLSAGEVDSVAVHYRGWPALYHPWIAGWKATTHTRASDFAEVPWVATISPPYGAQTWFPCKDTPTDKAKEVVLEITIPDSLQAICNGQLVKTEQVSDGRIQYIWKETYPIATYLIAVNICQYVHHRFFYRSINKSLIPIDFYLFESDTGSIPTIQKQLLQMMQFFEHLLGPYPFEREKYGMIIYNSTGGMENQTISSVQAFDPHRETLFAHELAHQWAGNLVTNSSFHESFLNEGLATYLTALYIQHKEGQAAFKKFLNERRVDKTGSIYVAAASSPDSVYHTQRVYYKGAWFFHMLSNIVDRDNFIRALRLYFTRFAYSHASSENLREVFEEVSGQDLSQFFQSWLFLKGIPAVSVKWHMVDKTIGSTPQYTYEIILKQHQKGKPFVMQLPLYIQQERKTTTLRLWMNQKNQKYIIKLDAPILSLQIDPKNDWLLHRYQ